MLCRVRKNVAGESAMRVIRTLRMLTPGSSEESRSSVRPSIPAETSSTTARAISETTKPPCRRREPPASVRAPARSVCSSSRAGARSAGASPKRRPLNSEAAMANSSTCQSSWTSSARGKLPGQNVTNGRIPDGREQKPEHASGKPQHRAFGQTLAHQAAPARAQRHAHGQFPLARNRARQQQAGDVRAGNQQHQADRAQQQPQRGPDIADIRTKRLRHEAAALVGFRVLLRQTAADHRQFRLCLGQRRAGPQRARSRQPDAACGSA